MAPIRKIYILALAVVLTGAFSPSALSQQTKESDTNNPIRGRAYTVVGYNGIIEWYSCLKFLPGHEFRISGDCNGVGTFSTTR
jgi:hypothetical protein